MAYQPEQSYAGSAGGNVIQTSSEMTVFVVDDDDAVREAIYLLLESAGLNAETYDSAWTFLETYAPGRKGCLVLDVRMPGMSGLELQSQLADRGVTIPIILLTGHADVPMAIRAFKAGAMDLIEKPFDSQIFLKRVRAALATQSAAAGEEAREAPPHTRELAHLTLASIGDGIISTSASGCVEYLNPVAEHLTGWGGGEAQGVPLQAVFCLVDEATREPVEDLLTPSPEHAEADQSPQLILIRRDGREFPIDLSVAPIRDTAGGTVGAVIIFHDATETRQLSYHATHDPLTGLINRREFERRLERLLASAREDDTEHALCYLDLDRFKVVNDVAGHAAGDQLLRQLSLLFQRKMRKRDSLARLGGDEFAVLLEHCPLNQAERIANILCQTAQDFRFVWEGRPFCVGVSIGVTSVSARSKGPTEILQAADAACYMAKGAGRNGVHVYRGDEASPLEQQGIDSRWLSTVSHALEENRFRLFQQAIAPMGEHEGGLRYEVLLRMEGSEAQALPAAAFLPVVERANLAADLDRWVIRQVLQWLAKHAEQLRQLHTCSINLSRHILADQNFPDFLIDQLAQTRVPAAKLCFEIAETTVIGELSQTMGLLEALKATGCRIAVDNFASTPSGFIYLRHLPVDLLKIDGFLVKDALDDPVSHALVKSIIEIAHVMGIETVAKGMENAALVETLRALDVDYLQGYYIARPMPLGMQDDRTLTDTDPGDPASLSRRM